MPYLGLDALLSDEGLQNASVSVLRVTEVEDLYNTKEPWTRKEGT